MIVVRPREVFSVEVDREPPSPCVTFDRAVVTVPGASSDPLRMAVALGGSEILAASATGRFFRISRSGAVLLTGLSTTTPHLGGFRSQSGRIWLVGKDGAV